MAGRRRGKGEGSVFRRADGYWVGRVEGPRRADGSRRWFRVVRKTKREALAALDELRRRRELGVSPQGGSRSVAQFLEWWSTSVLPGAVRDSTVENYQIVIRTYINPYVGRVRLDKLGPQHVRQMLHELEKAGKSPRVRQYARAVLRRALRTAEQDGLVLRNAAAVVDGPRYGGTRLDDTLTAAEARAVLDAARGDRLRALAALVLRLGLRKGEALALRWGDVDLDVGTLRIAGTLKRGSGGLYVDRPKTARGARVVPLASDTAGSLREHRRRQLEERIAMGQYWIDTDHVFTTELGTPLDPRNALRWWHALTAAAGLGKRRFHATRHTAATLMLDEGVPLEVVSAILGHAGLAITADVYAKVTDDAKRRALVTLGSALDLSE